MILITAISCGSNKTEQNWTHFVRTAGHGLNMDNVNEIVRSATETHVFGIETDNDIPGRYESLLNPEEKLKAIQAVAEKAHAAGNYAFVYIAGLECITAHADRSAHSFYKDHPDWVQRDRNGRPAVFGDQSAFWIVEGDEDVWITPYAVEWRSLYMERVRQIAATGIDGIYVDIPYWMTHFDGWEDTWASYDDYTVQAFRDVTGLDAREDIRPGDLNDPGFRKWIDFRIRTLTEFMAEIDRNVKRVNPDCMTIAEIYPGIGEDAVRVGADVYDMYPVVDVIAHEFSAGGYTAAARDPLSWFEYMIGMYSFRAFAEGKASWMLSYSWDGEDKIKPSSAMENLFAAQLAAGTNPWDARGHVMSGSNDMETRKNVYGWLAKHENMFFHPRQSIDEAVGLYFSPATRNYHTNDFISSYRGFFHLLLHSHLPFQVVTPRTLSAFGGSVLIMPDVKCLSGKERRILSNLVENGVRLIASGEPGVYDETGTLCSNEERHVFPGMLSGVNADEPVHRFPESCPGKAYLHALRKYFNRAAWTGQTGGLPFYDSIADFRNMLNQMDYSPTVELLGSPFICTQMVRVDGNPHVFIANFKGLKGKKTAEQIPEEGMMLRWKTDRKGVVKILPFLGEIQEVPHQQQQGFLTCILPPVYRGAVVWIEYPDK